MKKKSINGKNYYPVGTVWRGSNNIYKSIKKDSYGPKKETILISDVGTEPPVDFKLIWSTVDNECENCIPPENSFSIWRPIPPKGFVSLGDLVMPGDNKPDNDSIRCIPEKCVQELPVQDNSSVWNEKGFQKKEKPGINSKTNIKSYTKKVSIWPLGITEKEEEISNISFKKIDPLRIGGYNLFRANNAHIKPGRENGKGWEIKPSCYNIVKTDDPDIPSNDLGIGWLGGKKRENRYSVFTELNYTLTGFIINNDIKNSQNKGGCYIDHVRDQLYSVKYYNKNSKKFDKELIIEGNNLWKIMNVSKKDYIIKLYSSNTNKCIQQTHKNNGEIEYRLKPCESGGTNWKFTPSTGYSI